MNFTDLQIDGFTLESIPAIGIFSKKRLRKIEPGFKIPVNNYLQLAQWCDNCEDIEAHVYSHKNNKIRCLICKKTKQLK